MASFTLPPAFPIVGLPIVGAMVLAGYQSNNVMKARKEAGVKYPTLYVSEAEANADPKKMRFNCAQRAHGNTLENIPYVLGMFGYFSLFHPKLASVFFTHWIIGRFSYTAGYSGGNPSGRMSLLYKSSYIGLLGLFLGSAYVAITKSIEILL
ncbi:hypothetical protein I302_103708 [Kwoniella bestiolae CBS 10118]|uniref:Glutathione S-transferase n=1 Tax=Kwoniella bestiolae CBS 10118 TaxID=1296100 RepID=A0A1B9G948_9TREE|nr:hypothetical protein I302_02411 [Kwoniella bestiolae CBS 10118]OCF27568.1 hypothetical protein I302_02411 [Kwoniella bestiolae CBS 10118]